jgi:glycosyltransferase involved in cell wall biosynthesis
MNIPFFSIIIPTYNRAHFLSKAIESVLNQTFIDWELIIIDDGSTDNTKELVERYSDERIHYIWQNNQERSSARNNGIKIARGQYICFLDSDDYYKSDHLNTFYTTIVDKNYPKAFLYCDVTLQFNDGTLYDMFYEEVDEFNGNLDFILRRTIHSQQTCIHRKIFQKYQFNTRFRIGEDIELWVRICDEFPVIHVKSYTVVVVSHNARTIGAANVESCKAVIPLYSHIFKPPHPGSKISFFKKMNLYSTLYFVICRSNIVNKNKWNAIFYLIKALIYSPLVGESKHRLYLLYKLMVVKNYCEYYIKNEIVLV